MEKIAEYFKKKKYFTMGISLLLVAIFLVVSLWQFNKQMYDKEYKEHIKGLEGLAQQGSLLIEERLTGYVHELDGIAAFLPKGELHTEKNMDELRKRTGELGFQRIGLANTQGESHITSGSIVDVNDREYFKRAMTGHKVITESTEGKVNGKKVFMVAVPVFEKEEKVRGVLYGVLEVDSFGVYENTTLKDETQYVQVVDINGEYIMRAGKGRMPDRCDNIFTALEGYETDIPIDEIKTKMKNREFFLLEAEKGGTELISCFSPLRAERWYVLTILNKEHVKETVNVLLGSDLYALIAKTAAAFALLCLVIVYYRRKETEEIEKLYQKLKVNNKLVRCAIATSQNGVFIYDLKEDTINIINDPHKMAEFPKTITKARENLLRYLPENIVTKKQLEYIFENVGRISGKQEFELRVDGRKPGELAKNYVIHAEMVKDDYGNTRQCVGIVEDVTENRYLKMEMKLKERFLSSIFGFLVVNLSDDKIVYISRKMSEYCQKGDCYSETLGYLTKTMVDSKYRSYIANISSIQNLIKDFRNGLSIHREEYLTDNMGYGKFWMEAEINLERNSEGKYIAYISLKNIDEKKKAELVLKQEAERDYLTGLYNRRNGLKEISRRLAEHGDMENSNAFVMLDIDNFKRLNDTLGHQKGDEALKDIARIMERHFREYDVICRLAGDEFVVLLVDIPEDIIRKNIESLLKKLCLTYVVGNKQVNISASAGVVICPRENIDVYELYEKADKALYNAKRNGKNAIEFYME